MGTLFTRFDFIMAYRPGPKNHKDDALSRITTGEEKSEPEPIHLSRCWVNAIQWDFDKEISNTLPYHLPAECPIDRTYAPPRLKGKLNTWAHTTLTSRHPSSKYWW